MGYRIAQLIGGADTFVEVSAEKYGQIKEAKSNLLHALSIEVKLNYILENYCEYERELLNAAMDNMMFADNNWSTLFRESHLINRRIVNFLTACRLYVDHISHHIHQVYGKNSSETSTLQNKKSAEYAGSQAYRIIEEMRNYVQHRGFAIHLLKRHSGVVETSSGSRVRHTVNPYLRIDDIAKDKKFKKSIIEELKTIGDIIDIKPLIREYIEAIGRIHMTVRSLLKNDIRKWEEMIKDAISLYTSYGKDTVGLSLLQVDTDGSIIATEDLFTDFMTERAVLEGRNSKLNNIVSHYVSSEIIDGA